MSNPTSVPPALDPSSDALRQYLADGARRELEALRAALDARLAALEDALAHPDQHASLEDLVIDLARVVSGEAESAAARACLDAQLQAEDRTAEAIAGARTAVEVARTISDALRLDLEQTRGSLEAEREAAGAACHELREEAQAASEARAAVEARLEASETGRDNAERSWYEAESRADAAIRERGQLAAELEAVRQAASTAQLAFDSRLAAIDTQLAHLERASTDADARARDAVSSRDALQAELEAVRQGSPADAEHETRLEVADERIRALELQLFERDREARDRDIELSALLEDPPPAPAKPIRRANRYTFDAQFGVQIDDVTGVLVDLSISGAQVIWPHELPMNRIVTVSLPSDETPVSAEGRIAWTQIERGAKRQAPRFRTGIEFTKAGEVDVEAFIIRHAKS